MSYAAPNIIPSGTTFAQLQTSGLSGHLERLIAAQAAVANPTTAPTISLTGGGQSIANPTVAATVIATTIANPTVQATVATGAAASGTLPAGTYYAGYTWVDASGNESTLGTTHASVSNVFTVTLGLTPIVTIPSIPTGAVSANIYLSAKNGANTAVYLYAKGVTGTTYTFSSSMYWNNVLNAGLATLGIAPPSASAATGALAAAATGYFVGYTWVHAHGETAIGASASTVTVVVLGNNLAVTIPALPTGALGANIYVSAANGAVGTMSLYMAGVTSTVVNLTSASWTNGTTTQAAAVTPPAVNTTVGALAPGVYYAKATELNGIGETTATSESSTFTVTSQTNPSTANTSAGSGSGTLPAGAYFACYTYVDFYGNETTAGTLTGSTPATETASATTTTGVQNLVVTFGDTVPGWVASRNLYLTVAGGATGTETLYATGITTTTYTCSVPLWLNNTIAASAARAIPTVNSTSVDIPRVTKAALATGASAWNLYLTAAGGAAGSEVLYASGMTSLTVDCTIAAPSNSYATAAPTVNTTGLTYVDANSYTHNTPLDFLRRAKSGNLQDAYNFSRMVVADYLRGDPMSYSSTITKHRHANTVFAMLAQLHTEIGTLIDANAGHLKIGGTPVASEVGNSSVEYTGIGQLHQRRVFP